MMEEVPAPLVVVGVAPTSCRVLLTLVGQVVGQVKTEVWVALALVLLDLDFLAEMVGEQSAAAEEVLVVLAPLVILVLVLVLVVQEFLLVLLEFPLFMAVVEVVVMVQYTPRLFQRCLVSVETPLRRLLHDQVV
jgi:hypothetical protein